MQAVIFYFSGTGNTWWCSERMVEHLKRHGIESQMISIEQTDPEECARSICAADLVGIGYPIYGSDLPDIVKHFIDDILPTAPPQKPRLFLYCTQLMFSGDGAYVYADALRARGWEIYSAVHLLMPNNISMSIMPLLFRNDPVHIGRRLARTDIRIRHMMDRMIAGRPLKQGHSRLSTLLGLMQRAPFRTYFPVLRDDISVDDELCTRCGRCVEICPVGNLELTAEGVRASGQCILCLRCYDFCPVSAVRYRGRTPDLRRGVPYRGPVPRFRPELIAAPKHHG
jgi:ferredoxin/flavodoxin